MIEADAEPWSCPACTYLHAEEESQFLSCAICGTARPELDEIARTIAASNEELTAPADHGSADDDAAGLATAASLLAAQVAVDAALAAPLDRSAAISSLVESSLASRIAQQRA